MISRFLVAVAAAMSLGGSLSAQSICPPQVRWQQSFGTSNFEEVRRVLQTADGGFIMGGASFGPAGEGTKTAENYGAFDMYLIRVDADGHQLWDQSYGGIYTERVNGLEQTVDGGFLLAGTSASIPSGNKTSPNYGVNDFWVVRTDASGNKLWDKTFGGIFNDELAVVRQTSDYGFLLGGSSESHTNENKSSPGYGAYDFWIVRIDADGNKVWDKSFGGRGYDYLMDVQPTADGGFILGGWSVSDSTNGNKTAVGYGQYDYWIVRIDADGNKLWDRAYGGEWGDRLDAVLIAQNGDILLAGTSGSGVSGNKTVSNAGQSDFWVLRLDSAGNILWQKVYGGEQTENLESAAIVGDSFVLAGTSDSLPSGSKTSPRYRYGDYWIVKIDGNGNQLWDTSYGSMNTDWGKAVIPTSDNGYLIAGESYYVGGNKTAPYYGYSDIWLVNLRPENAADCDNDGVPNAQDLCANTPFGVQVNTNGCSFEQLCSCNGWLSHTDYVACVERVSADFERDGIITSSQRAELVAAAQDANCPPSLLRFGMHHLPLAGTIVNDAGEDSDSLQFIPGTSDNFGATILLGEADSGIFIDPNADNWGYGDPNWFLQGKVYGQFQNGSNALVVTVRATKPDIEIYPVDIDFTPLGATNLTFQYLTAGEVVREESSPGPLGNVTIHTSSTLGPRANPFKRRSDGSVGVLIQFISTPLDNEYDAIFVRADGVTEQIDFISRVEVEAGGGLDTFYILDERLGMFRNGHRIIGYASMFEAANRHLAVTSFESGGFGTSIEFDKSSHFEADFLPIVLGTNDESGLNLYQPNYGMWLGLASTSAGLSVRPNFSGLWDQEGTNPPPTDTSIEMKVYRNGILVGTCVTPNGLPFPTLVTSNQQQPRIIGCGLSASSNTAPAIAFSLDEVATLVCTNGSEISGTHFRVAPTNPAQIPPDFSSLSVTVNGPLAFTITGERSAEAQPRLAISSSGNTVTLSWPDNTRLFRLESSPSLPNGFTAVPDEPTFVDGLNQVTVSREATGSRFFRLRSGPD